MDACVQSTLDRVYRREALSFLQYVRQTTPYAGPADRPLAGRLREMAATEADALERFADWLEDWHMTRPQPGAFPSAFTNYNFVAVRKLLPGIVTDHARALAELERDLATLPPGGVRDQVEGLAAMKRMHLTELEKVGQNGQVRPTSAATL
jgi:hypothetical protein